MKKVYYGDFEVLLDACRKYKAAMFGMMNPDEEKIRRFNTAENEYKKAIKGTIKYLREELKNIDEWRNDYERHCAYDD